MLNFFKKRKGQAADAAQADVAQVAQSRDGDVNPAMSDKLPCQSMAVNGVDLVFGAAWTPASEESSTKKILSTGFNEGFVYYTTNEYESTVGLFGELPKEAKNAHAAAAVFAQHFSAGGIELFVFQRKAQWFYQMQVCACVGTQPDNVAGIGRDFGFE